MSDDPDVTNVLKFLREREVVHFQRFGEALRTVQDKLAEKKFYMNNNNIMVPNNTVTTTDTSDCGCGMDTDNTNNTMNNMSCNIVRPNRNN